MDKINFIDLKAQMERVRPSVDAAITNVLNHGQYILGPEVSELENQLKQYTNANDVITCANGTDALRLTLMALDLAPGDGVIVPSFSFAATCEVVADLKAIPIFADICPHTFNLAADSVESALKVAIERDIPVKGIIAVDIFGNPADYISLNEIAAKYDLWLIGDSAQSFGAKIYDDKVGNIAQIATTSFFPAKVLGCCGDGGAIFVKDNSDIAEKIRSLRNHGAGQSRYDHIHVGLNSRLDSMQAAILLEKLKIFDDELEQRSILANYYRQNLPTATVIPQLELDNFISNNALFSVRIANANRDEFKEYLQSKDIPNVVYYHKPLYLQPAYEAFPRANITLENTQNLCDSIVSLPLHPYMGNNQIEYIVDKIHKFFDM